MITVRLPVLADLLYEVHVRDCSPTEQMISALLTLYKEVDEQPVIAKAVRKFYKAGDLSSFEVKVEQVREISSAFY